MAERFTLVAMPYPQTAEDEEAGVPIRYDWWILDHELKRSGSWGTWGWAYTVCSGLNRGEDDPDNWTWDKDYDEGLAAS